MSFTLAVAIYVVLWWTVLFAILPIGVRTQGEDGAIVPGTPASAPAAPASVSRRLVTTLVSALVFAGAVGVDELRHYRSGALMGAQGRWLAVRSPSTAERVNEKSKASGLAQV